MVARTAVLIAWMRTAVALMTFGFDPPDRDLALRTDGGPARTTTGPPGDAQAFSTRWR